MSSSILDIGGARRAIPEAVVGEVRSIAPIGGGLSGAGVYRVSCGRGEFVLRVQARDTHDWIQYRLILDRASAASVAPPVVHVDDDARAVLFRHIDGVPLYVALGDARRERAIADVLQRLHVVRTIEATGIAERDALGYARGVWETQRSRTDLPHWLVESEPLFDRIETVLAADRRRVVSHNDVNPGNVLWDGTRSWLVDWDAAGLGHPYYDLATFVTFLGVDTEQGYEMLARAEDAPVDDDMRATFTALRQLVALAIGYSFLGGVPDITARAPTRARAPTIADVRAAVRSGALELLSVEWRAMYGLAMLEAAFSF